MNPRVILERAMALVSNGSFILTALHGPELAFDAVEPLAGRPVGLLLGFAGFLLCLDEAVEPARQVQKFLGE